MTQTTATEYAEERGVQFDWTADGYARDDNGWEHQRLTVTITVPPRVPAEYAHVFGPTAHSFTWRQGLGIESDPDVGSVLYTLVSDAYAGEESFDDFCANYGLDTDSRKAHKTWKKCRKTADKLVDLFGEIPCVEEG